MHFLFKLWHMTYLSLWNAWSTKGMLILLQQLSLKAHEKASLITSPTKLQASKEHSWNLTNSDNNGYYYFVQIWQDKCATCCPLYNGSFSHHLNIGYCFFINNYYLKQPLTTHSILIPPSKSQLCIVDPTIKRWHPIKLFYSRKIVSENALLAWRKPEVSSYHTPYKKFLLKVQLSTYSNESNPNIN